MPALTVTVTPDRDRVSGCTVSGHALFGTEFST